MPKKEAPEISMERMGMLKVHEIKFDDISVAEEYAVEYGYERCVNALWSIYNVLKK